MFLTLVLLVVLIATSLFRRSSKFWLSRGIPGPTPLPIVGNYAANIIGKRNIYEISADIYKKYADYPFVGIHKMGGDPCLLLRDPKIIKNILVKDFSHFVDNDIFVDKKLDPMFGRSPFVLKGEEWKTARQQLTPGFAPAKIKTFLPLVEKVAQNFVSYLARHEGTTLNVKEICGRYTCDTVALCAFGLEGNSFDDSNADFLQIMRKIAPDTSQIIQMALNLFIPQYKIKILPKSFDDAVMNITKETLKYRQKNNIKRKDYFEAMCEIGKGSLVETAAHLSGFMLDGYETSSTGMTLTIYELARNPTCQQKLRNEINNVLEKNNGELSYEALKDMTYLEACINETLRIHPPLGQLAKTCTKSYNITSISPEFKNLSITIEPGTPVMVPLLGLHMDPKYFASPENFVPERFLDQTEGQKHVYMPFGTGQRTCLGSRLALLQLKVGLAAIIKNFEIKLDKKSQGPLKYDPMHILLNPIGGGWITCRKVL